MVIDIIIKIVVALSVAAVTGLVGWLIQQIRKYKKLNKKEEDENIKLTITNTLTQHLEPIQKDINNIKTDVANLQKFETNFQTRLDPVQEEIEHLKDDTTIILKQLKEQGIDIQNIKDKEDLLEEKTRCSWRYRIRTLCLAYIKRGYMTHEEFSQLQEMFSLYVALGGNGQTKELYEKTLQLEIKPE